MLSAAPLSPYVKSRLNTMVRRLRAESSSVDRSPEADSARRFVMDWRTEASSLAVSAPPVPADRA